MHSRDIIYTSFKRDGRILTLQIILLGFKVYTSFIRGIVKIFYLIIKKNGTFSRIKSNLHKVGVNM